MTTGITLNGAIVLLTGAAGSLGTAMAKAIETGGGTVIRTDLARHAGMDYALDVTSEADWVRVVAAISAQHGRLDGLVNNAGIGTMGDVETTSYDDWKRVMAINADGVFLGCKYAMPLLEKSKAASIVIISSASGLVGGTGMAAYSASKGAARLLSKCVALSGARKSPPIRCNSVHPAFIDSDMVDSMVDGSKNPERTRQKLTSQIPLGRMGQPAEVANAVVWLLSSASSFSTGTEIVVDGGLVAQ
jgi:3(or 17)beta-hydroxysteroid dehydrogenase